MDERKPVKKKTLTDEELRKLREEMGQSLIERDEQNQRWKDAGAVGKKLSAPVRLWWRIRSWF